MFYDKFLDRTPKIEYVKVKFPTFAGGIDAETDENLVANNKACLSYNFHYENGALTTGYGVEGILLPITESDKEFTMTLEYEGSTVKYKGAWLYNYYSEEYSKYQRIVVLYGDDNKIYWFKLFSFDPYIYPVGKVMQSMPNGLHYTLNGKDMIILTSKEDGMLVWRCNSNPVFVEDAPKIKSMCLHDGRLFAIVDNDRTRVWYSSNLDPTSWNVDTDENAGRIELPVGRGNLNKIVSFNDYIYVIRDFSILRINYYAATDTYQVSQLCELGGRIHSGTIAVCGEKIFMLTDDGFYSFDGDELEKIRVPISPLLTNHNDAAVGAFFKEKYFVACRLNYSDGEVVGEEVNPGYVNNTLVAIDVNTGKFTLTRGVDICWMLPVNEMSFSKLLLCVNGEKGSKICELSNTGKYFSEVLPKVWNSPMTDLGRPEKKKLIKELYIKSQQFCRVCVKTESEKKVFEIQGGNKIRKIVLKMKAQKLALSFESMNEENFISTPEILVGLV